MKKKIELKTVNDKEIIFKKYFLKMGGRVYIETLAF